MQGYCDVYKWTILKQMSPEVKCLHPTSSRREMCMLSVRRVIYHKFSHGASFYMLNGKNVNVMLEFDFFQPDNGDSFAKKGDLIFANDHIIEMVTKASLVVKNLTTRLPEVEIAPQ